MALLWILVIPLVLCAFAGGALVVSALMARQKFTEDARHGVATGRLAAGIVLILLPGVLVVVGIVFLVREGLR